MSSSFYILFVHFGKGQLHLFTRRDLMKKEKLVEVKLHGATAFFTNSELLTVMKFDEEIYTRALKRGKGILRARKQKQREKVKYAKEENG